MQAPDSTQCHCFDVHAELLRENKRQLDKAIRELDRERMGLQQQEKKTIAEIKKMAKEGQMVSARARRGHRWPTGPPGPASEAGWRRCLPESGLKCLNASVHGKLSLA
jgi:hypothetical protein